MDEIISRLHHHHSPRVMDACADEIMDMSDRQQALLTLYHSMTDRSLDILPVFHLILKKARKRRDPISIQVADLLIQNDWFKWISTHQNEFSIIVKHDILVLIVDLIKAKSQNEMMAIPMEQMIMMILEWAHHGHPLTRKSLEAIYRWIVIQPSFIIPILDPFNQFLMGYYFDKKELFQIWWNQVSTLEEYTEFCLPLGSFDRQSLRYSTLIATHLCSYALQNDESAILLLLENLTTRLSETNVLESLWTLFGDDDAQLFQWMQTKLELDMLLEERSDTNFGTATQKAVLESHSHRLFAFFCFQVAYDPSVILDFLTSAETAFLEYFIKYLRFMDQHFESVVAHCNQLIKLNSAFQDGLENTEELLTLLRDKIKVLHRRNLFAFSPEPLLRRIDRVLSLMSGLN